jgi:hypothetical protein
MAIDYVANRHKKIQNMSLDKMAEYFGKTLDLFPKIDMSISCPVCKSCEQCWKQFLLGSDN